MKKKETGVFAQVSFKLSVALILGCIGLVLGIVYWTLPNIRTELTFIAAILGGLAVLHTTYYMAEALKVNTYRDKLAWSFNITKELNQKGVIDIRMFLEKKIANQNIPPADFYNKIISDTEIHASTKMLLGLFEDASIAVQNGLADEESLYKSLAFLVPWAAQNFHPYIQQVRKNNNDNSIYRELDKLADAWKNNSSLVTKKHFEVY